MTNVCDARLFSVCCLAPPAAAFAISYTVFVYHDAHSHPSSLGGAIVRGMQSKALVALLSFSAFALTAMAMALSAYELNGTVDQAFGYGPAQLLLTSENLNICLNGEPDEAQPCSAFSMLASRISLPPTHSPPSLRPLYSPDPTAPIVPCSLLRTGVPMNYSCMNTIVDFDIAR